MSYIILECGQRGYCLISVPQRIADDARCYQMDFDKWLMDKTNDHGYWLIDPDEEPYLCYDPPAAFVKWLNDHVLCKNEKAELIEGDWPLLHF